MKAISLFVVFLSLPLAAEPALDSAAADIQGTLKALSVGADPHAPMPAAYWDTQCEKVVLKGRETASASMELRSVRYQEFCSGTDRDGLPECWTDRVDEKKRTTRLRVLGRGALPAGKKESFKICLTADELRVYPLKTLHDYAFSLPGPKGRTITARVKSGEDSAGSSYEEPDSRDSGGPWDTGDLDEIGNPRRDAGGGPDSTDDSPWWGGDRSDSDSPMF